MDECYVIFILGNCSDRTPIKQSLSRSLSLICYILNIICLHNYMATFGCPVNKIRNTFFLWLVIFQY